MTFISGTLSGDKSTDLLLRSKASRNMRFFVAEPHKRYKPVEIETVVVIEFLSAKNLPIISRPLLSISSTHLLMIIGTCWVPVTRPVATPPGTPPVLFSLLI